jgi:hypothetical protein
MKKQLSDSLDGKRASFIKGIEDPSELNFKTPRRTSNVTNNLSDVPTKKTHSQKALANISSIESAYL